MKGSYVLLIRLGKSKRIEVGSLGEIVFRKGFYAYVGSAMNSMENRIGRHTGRKRKIFWHIDYLLRDPESVIAKVFALESERKDECRIAEGISTDSINAYAVPGFGCSDCRCGSHLFFCAKRKDMEAAITQAMVSIHSGTLRILFCR